jgi:hypothetical protein
MRAKILKANTAIHHRSKRDELFKQFENHPGKLSLATEIKIIDDQIAEEARGKKKARTAQTKEYAVVSCSGLVVA